MEACVTERLTPRTLDLEVRGSSLARRVVSVHKKLYSTLSLFTQVYKWVPATYCWWGVVAILLGMLYAKETGIRCDRLGLWLVCAFFTSTVAFHFYVRRCVKCTYVNKVEVVYKKVARKRSTSTLRATLHTLPGNPPQGI